MKVVKAEGSGSGIIGGLLGGIIGVMNLFL